MDCVFCKIAAGEIPSKKAYEDDRILAFYDLDPQAPVHILLIPKEHIESAADITEENSAIVAHIFAVAAKLRQVLLRHVAAFALPSNILPNNGSVIFHTISSFLNVS